MPKSQILSLLSPSSAPFAHHFWLCPLHLSGLWDRWYIRTDGRVLQFQRKTTESAIEKHLAGYRNLLSSMFVYCPDFPARKFRDSTAPVLFADLFNWETQCLSVCFDPAGRHWQLLFYYSQEGGCWVVSPYYGPLLGCPPPPQGHWTMSVNKSVVSAGFEMSFGDRFVSFQD